MRSIRVATVVILVLVALQEARSAAPLRTIHDLGGIAGRTNWALDINDHGDVVGVGAYDIDALSEIRGLLWSGGTLATLRPLPGHIASWAESINNRRQVVGYSLEGLHAGAPVLWEGGTVTRLEALPGQVTGQAIDINDHGEIAGAVMLYDSWTGEQRAVVWRNGRIVDLFPATVTFSSALAINNRGQVVGQAFGTLLVRDGNIMGSMEIDGAYLWERGRVTLLGGLDGSYAVPNDINDRGQVTGVSRTPNGDFHAFLWERGRMRDLGTVTQGHSTGLGLNNKGEVVGQADPGVGFLWRQGEMSGLGFLQATFSRAESINKKGVIVGNAAHTDGQGRAVMWVEGARQITPRWIQPGAYE